MELRSYYSHSGTSFPLTAVIMASLTSAPALAASMNGGDLPPNGNMPQNKTPMASKPSSSSRTTILGIILVLSTLLLPIILAILPEVLSIAHRLFQLLQTTTKRISRGFSAFRNQLLTPLLPNNFLPRRFTSTTGNVPTKGVTLFLLLLVSLTLLLTLIAPGYRTPHVPSPALKTDPNITSIFQRTGTFAFAFLPVAILFSSRNNLLMLLGTRLPGAQGFSHNTFLVLHRWIGRLCALLAVIHSLLAIPLYLGKFHGIIHAGFWIWGSAATIALCLMVGLGSVYFRRRFYEPFLLGHILLSIIVLVGCWYHVENLRDKVIGPSGGWIIAAVVVWGFDRVVRTVRVVVNGVRKARVTEFGDDGEYVRIDIPPRCNSTTWATRGLFGRPGLHIYVQFPGLDWKRPWENHPFSVVPTCLLSRTQNKRWSDSSGISSPTDGGSSFLKDPGGDAEKGVGVTEGKVSTSDTVSEITLLVKKSEGLTRHLKACDSLLTLLDGPYPNNPTTTVFGCERLLLIGGGIGITGVLPWISHHPNVKLAWGMKESARCLVEQLEPAVDKVAEKDIRIGKRLDIERLVADEANMGWSRVGVVVSGPASLCDDVRVAVASAGRKAQGAVVFELEVDAYSW